MHHALRVDIAQKKCSNPISIDTFRAREVLHHFSLQLVKMEKRVEDCVKKTASEPWKVEGVFFLSVTPGQVPLYFCYFFR